MLAESIHSLADTGNQGLLFLGGKRRAQAADRRSTRSATAASATSGRSSSRWCCSRWAALFALYEGIEKLLHPHELESPPVAVRHARRRHRARGLLAAHRGARRRRPSRGGPVVVDVHPHAPRAPSCPVVLLEDTGALVGLVFALVGVTLAEITGNAAVGRASARIAIGLLLGRDRGDAGDRDEEPAHRRVGAPRGRAARDPRRDPRRPRGRAHHPPAHPAPRPRRAARGRQARVRRGRSRPRSSRTRSTRPRHACAPRCRSPG